jgi:hypothetical protein
MKGLNDRTEFENEWQKAFDNAEAEPSQEVWTGINAFLANNEATHYKRKAFYYKLVAAASITIAVGLGVWGVLGRFSNDPQVAGQEIREFSGKPSSGPQDAIALADQMEDSGMNNMTEGSSTVARGAVSENRAAMTQQDQHVAGRALGTMVAATQDEVAISDSQEREGALLSWIEKKGTIELASGLAPRTTHINKVMDLRAFYAAIKPKQKAAASNLWAGVSFSGGNFNPEFSSKPGLSGNFNNYIVSSGSFSQSNSWYRADNLAGLTPAYLKSDAREFNQASQDINMDSDPGLSYSFGFNLGGRISNKFVWQSGLSYARRMTNSSTSFFVLDSENKVYPLHVTNFSTATTMGGNYIFNYQFWDVPIRNNYQFISIPVKAGYNLVDKKFGATLFTGISSEFFMGSKIDDSGNGGLESVTVQPGSESPYRNLWFNGLVSMELKYNFGGLYSAFIEPSYKISLNSFTKPDFEFSSYPRSFHIGMGLKFNLD